MNVINYQRRAKIITASTKGYFRNQPRVFTTFQDFHKICIDIRKRCAHYHW